MKILALADLHIGFHSKIVDNLMDLTKNVDHDVVVVAGDVVESTQNNQLNTFDVLSYITDKPIVFCLGNHEFIHRTPQRVHEIFREFTRPRNDIYCLDIDGHAEIDGVNFVGNVLWYDGSMSTISGQSKSFVDPRWLDSQILDFNFMELNNICEADILSNYNPKLKNVLVTHTCPHHSLNAFMDTEYNFANMYSGVYDLFQSFEEEGCHFDVAICGHTHRKVELELYGTKCYNIGNEYFNRTGNIEYKLIEI